MNKIFIAILYFSLFGLVEPAQATDANAPADSILAKIALFQTEVVELKTQLPGLVGEDSLIIDHEVVYAQLKTLQQFYLLVDYLAAHKEDHPIRPKEQDLLTQVPNSLIQAETSLVRQLKEMRGKREQIPAHKLGEFEENIASLMEQTTKIQSLIFDFLQAMKKLDQPEVNLNQHLQTELQGRTRILIGRLRIALEQEASLKRRIPLPATGDDAILLQATELRINANVNNLRQLIALMKQTDLNTTSHEAFLIESTGQLTTTDLASGALARFLNNWLQKVIDFLRENGLNILVKILIVVGLLVLFHYLGKLASTLVIKSIDASGFKPSRLLRNMIKDMSSRIIMLVGILIALSQIGISLGPMLAGLGVVGFIVGFALQDTLANFASGIMILLYRPFDVGDMVESGTVFGKVKQMSLVSTTILTIDNQTLVVPNNMIWGDVIKNVTAQNLRRVDMVFGVAYSEEIPKVERILMEILESNEMVLKNPPPQIKLHKLDDSSMNFVVRPWVRTDNYWDVHWDVTREVKMRFDAEGVSIPFPQTDVHLFENKTEG